MALAFGAGPRESSNFFASGASQNCGNVLTGTPTTRVTRPPGGASSFKLAWDTPEPSNEPRRGSGIGRGMGASSLNLAWDTPEPSQERRHTTRAGTRPPEDGRKLDVASETGFPRQIPARTSGNTISTSEEQSARLRPRAGMSTICLAWDDDSSHTAAGHLDTRTLRTRGHKQQEEPRETTPRSTTLHSTTSRALTPRSTASQAHVTEQSCVRAAKAASACGSEEGSTSATTAETRTSTPRSERVKEEIAGSRPRVYKPSIRLQAPPGGGSSFNSDWSGGYISGSKVGKKRFPEAGGAGSNRDAHTIEALRYYTDHDDSVGRLKVQEGPHWVEKRDLDVQRYHLSPEGLSDKTLGRARQHSSSGSTQSGSSDGHTPRSIAQSGSSAQESWIQRCDAQSSGSFDSLPLGAEWCTWHMHADRDVLARALQSAHQR